jgi:hypothetical protein
VPLSDGGHVLGAATAALHIGPAGMADEGTYTVRISSPCAITTSTPATLTVVCYANCDGSTAAPILNVDDFVCFINLYTAGDERANCDGSTEPPVLNILDILCFHAAYRAGCP